MEEDTEGVEGGEEVPPYPAPLHVVNSNLPTATTASERELRKLETGERVVI